MKYYVYIIESELTGVCYMGYHGHSFVRLEQRNAGLFSRKKKDIEVKSVRPKPF